jgi:G:T-mismatch repair DNA endonuclease (very short patch repair protein)
MALQFSFTGISGIAMSGAATPCFRRPRPEFWLAKLDDNVAPDRRNTAALKGLG